MVTEARSPGARLAGRAGGVVAQDESLDPAFRALALRLPSEDDMAQTLHDAGITPDPDRIHEAREKLARALAPTSPRPCPALIDQLAEPGPYTPDAKAAGCRALRLRRWPAVPPRRGRSGRTPVPRRRQHDRTDGRTGLRPADIGRAGGTAALLDQWRRTGW
jgi:aminopeptidase N